MAKPYLVIILFVSLIITSIGNFSAAKASKQTKSDTIQLTKQHTKHRTALFEELTAQDRKNYVLLIDQRKIGKPHDTILYNGKFKAFNVPVKLSNLSNDTLRYLSMSCSWDDFFLVSNKKLKILSWPCESNDPIDKFVLPHKSVTYSVPVAVMNRYIRDDKLRIGMNLFIVNNKNRRFTWDLILSDYKIKNLIWSNEVMIH